MKHSPKEKLKCLSAYSSREFVCSTDSNDVQVVTPFNICIPKVYTIFYKDKQQHIGNPEKQSVNRFKYNLYFCEILMDYCESISLADGISVLEKH